MIECNIPIQHPFFSPPTPLALKWVCLCQDFLKVHILLFMDYSQCLLMHWHSDLISLHLLLWSSWLSISILKPLELMLNLKFSNRFMDKHLLHASCNFSSILFQLKVVKTDEIEVLLVHTLRIVKLTLKRVKKK